jgi:Tol biopolymer transport system component
VRAHCHRLSVRAAALGVLVASLTAAAPRSRAQRLQSSDLYRLRSVGAVALSPDGRLVAYSMTMFDRPGRPYSQIWIMDLASRKAVRLGENKEMAYEPLWSPDGKWVTYPGGEGESFGLWVAHADGSGAGFLAPVKAATLRYPGRAKA